ncbi:hypothetical protein ACFSJU_17335 [Paradesertivirga mongoliensis]|uniref:Uncharacterized protein n=1 Tax=Paradesertivirga mongoliensis TaxID=2100740 RepID=A0ABW4ZRB1_9SPHI|nr:hypothetical protein [Pedobacter mongoliensis]
MFVISWLVDQPVVSLTGIFMDARLQNGQVVKLLFYQMLSISCLSVRTALPSGTGEGDEVNS